MGSPMCERWDCDEDAEVLAQVGSMRRLYCRICWQEEKKDMLLMDFGEDYQ